MADAERRVFKGMGRFTYSDPAHEYHDANRSAFRLWYDYLRLSKDYWWVCQQQGETLDADLHDMWRDFGDVYAMDFYTWWKNRGRELFSEQVSLPRVRLIDESATLHPNTESHVLVEIPLNLTERTIGRQVMAIVRAHANRLIKPVSHAKRPLAKLRGIRLAVIRDAHTIWCLKELVELAKKGKLHVNTPFDKMTYQKIGIALRVVKSCMPKHTDGEEKERMKRIGMKVGVQRMLNRANALIANAEIGIFPSIAPVAKRERWTVAQKKALDAAIAADEWRPPEVHEQNFRRIIRQTIPL
jgi:hypothetical protein